MSVEYYETQRATINKRFFVRWQAKRMGERKAMNMRLTFKTKARCQDYLEIMHNGNRYSINNFAKKYRTTDFSLDEKIKETILLYRGKEMDYEEMCRSNYDFSEKLKFIGRYAEEIYPKEHVMLEGNIDYYKASKYLNKTEKCLQTARYYLICSYNKIISDSECNWDTGYAPHFLLRTMNFTTAVIWYNSCFDYILQIVYFAFGIYKKIDGYTDQTSHEDLLKKCNYYSMGEIYSKYKAVPNYNKMWKIINKCYNALSEINTWANYIKHKGGISFVDLNPQEPITIEIKDVSGNIIAKSSDFESIRLDLDDSINVLKVVHESLYICINSLIDLIDFKGIEPQNHPEGKK